MHIKQADRHNVILNKANSLMRCSRRARWLIVSISGIILASAVILASIYYGMILQKEGKAYTLNKVLQARLRIIPNRFRGLTANPKRIAIGVKHINYQKLAYKREVARAKGLLITGPEDYVPAVIDYGAKTVRAMIRLKGDWTNSLRGDTWSFRIKIRGDDTLFGMERFSIHHPRERNYIYEWIFFQALGREGVIAPRYEFIKVLLNGKDLGIYALEEHFEKRLIEKNKYLEGPIIKFNEDRYWAEQLSLKSAANTPTELQLQLAADIDAFKMNTILRNPKLFKQFVIAKDLLELFRNGELPAHKVFDVRKLAKYFAISELMGGLHGAGRWHNLRFYYNPLTSLLEPIGFDAMAGEDLKTALAMIPIMVIKDRPDVFHSRVFSDMVFFKEYVKELEKVSQRDYLDELFEDIDADLQKNLDIIYSECPYFIFSKDSFYQNQKYMRNLLDPIEALHPYLRCVDKTGVELALGNVQSLPIKVQGVSYRDSFLFPPVENTVLLPMAPSKPVKYNTVRFLFPANFMWSEEMTVDLKLKYRLLGASEVRSRTVFPYPNLSDGFIENDFMRQSSNVSDFEFLSMDNSAAKIFIQPGDWHVDKNLIVPSGYELVCEEGTRLTLTNSAKILSYSSFKFVGTEKDPIHICAGDSTGQGVVVINSGNRSFLQHVVFQNLSNPSQGGWDLTGAVTFYESPVDIKDCQFLDSRAEDALNIIRSDFSVERSLFSKAFSDAFDGDFSEGTITDSSFRGCGGDAIDCCGSVVQFRNIYIDGAGDKGLSVGEKSRVQVDFVEIKNAEIAVASKDLSEIYGSNIVISDCNTGFALYQKKSEFGPSTVTVSDVTISLVNTPCLIEDGSELRIDRKRINAEAVLQ